MGKKLDNKLNFFTFFVTGFTIGLIIGASGLSILISTKLEKQYEKIAILENTISDTEIKLKKLEESINKKSYVLKDVQINVIGENIEDQLDKITVEKTIKQKYSDILGKNVNEIDINLVSEVIDNRVFLLEDGQYLLHVKKVFLCDILSIWVELEELQ